ncbi:MAG: LysM domain-containing protein [Quisquiliibacterium sp.]
MKNFNTQTLAMLLGVVLASLTGKATATGPLEIARNAPDRHVVVRGDTLWGIAGKFLTKPWRWPEIWRLNREQIANPHLIYPGDIIYLDKSGATPRLRLARQVASGSSTQGNLSQSREIQLAERRSPGIRSKPLPPEPVPTIDIQAVEPFLTRPLIVNERALAFSPRIVAAQDGRVFLSRGEIAYVRGISDETISDWQVYRNPRPLIDPETRRTLAFEAEFVGTARFERGGDPATIRITGVNAEIGPGDRLLPADKARFDSFVPRPPDDQVQGRIVSVYRGVAQAGRNSVVALNLGSADSLQVGHVLEIRERGRMVRDPQERRLIRLPGEAIGHLLVFRTFDTISYALIMESSRDVNVGDGVFNP